MFLEHLLSVVIVAETGFYAAPESGADFKRSTRLLGNL